MLMLLALPVLAQTKETKKELPVKKTEAPATVRSGCPQAMSASDYENAKNSIALADGENRKLCLARDIMNSTCFSAEQVEGIMNLFTLETSKLEFAKLAFDHTSDVANYSKVNEAFKEISSAAELKNYIDTH